MGTKIAAAIDPIALLRHAASHRRAHPWDKDAPGMPILLDCFYVIALILASPWLLWRAIREGKYRSGWRQKLQGRVPRRPGNQPCLWFHAVSVGEVRLLRPLVEELSRRRHDLEIVISTTTTTGLEMARELYPELPTFYAPLDFSWAVRRAIARIRPTVLALVELELWPNLIRAATESGACVAIVNARLSETSFKGYSRVSTFLAPTMRRLELVAAQSDEYAERFIALGVPSRHTRVTGSVKYDGLESDRCNPKTLALRRTLKINASDVIFVAGSTMDGEELAAYHAFRAAKSHHPRLRLIIVPRHKERFDAVAAALKAEGASVARRTELQSTGNLPAPDDVILVDTIGELSAVWGLADVAFVGGSLFRGRGGQNMLEPSAYGAAVIFGAHTANFKDAVEGLLACGGARRVHSPEELRDALIADLDDPEAAHSRASAARAYVLAQNGAAARTTAELERLMPQNAPLSLIGSR